MVFYCKGAATIEHEDTEERFEIHPGDLVWDITKDCRKMGLEIFYEAHLEHAQLGDLCWWVFEYPVGAEDGKGTDVGGNKIIANFEYGIDPDCG